MSGVLPTSIVHSRFLVADGLGRAIESKLKNCDIRNEGDMDKWRSFRMLWAERKLRDGAKLTNSRTTPIFRPSREDCRPR